jgi:hypothetical protein
MQTTRFLREPRERPSSWRAPTASRDVRGSRAVALPRSLIADALLVHGVATMRDRQSKRLQPHKLTLDLPSSAARR